MIKTNLINLINEDFENNTPVDDRVCNVHFFWCVVVSREAS